jgi:hypothetical protein
MSSYLQKMINSHKSQPESGFIRPSKDSDIGTAQSDANHFLSDSIEPHQHHIRAKPVYTVHTLNFYLDNLFEDFMKALIIFLVFIII